MDPYRPIWCVKIVVGPGIADQCNLVRNAGRELMTWRRRRPVIVLAHQDQHRRGRLPIRLLGLIRANRIEFNQVLKQFGRQITPLSCGFEHRAATVRPTD